MKQKLLTVGTILFASGFSNLSWCENLSDSGVASKLPDLVHFKHFSEAKVAPVPGMPTCTKGLVLRGDPSTGPASMMGKMDKGCVVTIHWHSANEETIVSQGTIKVQLEGQAPIELKAGSYMFLPAKTKHRYWCVSKEDCWMYDAFDRPFDIHNVNEAGEEISTEEAIRATGSPANLKW